MKPLEFSESNLITFRVGLQSGDYFGIKLEKECLLSSSLLKSHSHKIFTCKVQPVFLMLSKVSTARVSKSDTLCIDLTKLFCFIVLYKHLLHLLDTL